MSFFLKIISRYYRWKIARLQKKTRKLAKKDLAKAEKKLREGLLPSVIFLNELSEEPITDDNKIVDAYEINRYSLEKLLTLSKFINKTYDELLMERGEN